MDRNGGDGDGDCCGDAAGLLWRLPTLKAKDLGKLGPGIGFGAGCGVGFGIGLIGGGGHPIRSPYAFSSSSAGLGARLPDLQFGFGLGAGCGIGLGFGYGVGRGVAYDENKRYTNVGKLFRSLRNLPEKQIDVLFDDFIMLRNGNKMS